MSAFRSASRQLQPHAVQPVSGVSRLWQSNQTWLERGCQPGLRLDFQLYPVRSGTGILQLGLLWSQFRIPAICFGRRAEREPISICLHAGEHWIVWESEAARKTLLRIG